MFHPGLHWQVEASTCQFPGSATPTCSPSLLQQPSLSRIHVTTCFLQEALHLTHAQTPAFCILVSQKPWQLSRPPPPGQDGPSTSQPLTPKDIWFRIATPKFLRTEQQQGKALKSPVASGGTAQTFQNIPVRGQGAMGRLHRVGRLTPLIPSEVKGMPCRRAPTSRRHSARHAPARGPPSRGLPAPGGRTTSPLPALRPGGAWRHRHAQPGPRLSPSSADWLARPRPPAEVTATGAGRRRPRWVAAARQGAGLGEREAGRWRSGSSQQPLARGLKMAGVAGSSPVEAGGGGGGVSSSSSAAAVGPPAEAEAVAADWMLEFACYCLCRHFGEGRAAPFRRWRAVAQGEGRRRRRLSGLRGRGRAWLSGGSERVLAGREGQLSPARRGGRCRARRLLAAEIKARRPSFCLTHRCWSLACGGSSAGLLRDNRNFGEFQCFGWKRPGREASWTVPRKQWLLRGRAWGLLGDSVNTSIAVNLSSWFGEAWTCNMVVCIPWAVTEVEASGAESSRLLKSWRGFCEEMQTW